MKFRMVITNKGIQEYRRSFENVDLCVLTKDGIKVWQGKHYCNIEVFNHNLDLVITYIPEVKHE